jgi:hypothetical protein
MPLFEEGADPLRQDSKMAYWRTPLGGEKTETPYFAPSSFADLGNAVYLLPLVILTFLLAAGLLTRRLRRTQGHEDSQPK